MKPRSEALVPTIMFLEQWQTARNTRFTLRMFCIPCWYIFLEVGNEVQWNLFYVSPFYSLNETSRCGAGILFEEYNRDKYFLTWAGKVEIGMVATKYLILTEHKSWIGSEVVLEALSITFSLRLRKHEQSNPYNSRMEMYWREKARSS